MKIPAVILCKLQREHAAKVIPKFSHYWSSLNRINQKLHIIWRLFYYIARVGFGMEFFRDRDFLFWERSESPIIPDLWNFFGILWKSPKFLTNPPDSGFLKSRDFIPRDSGFFDARDFNPRDSGIFLISGFLSPGSGFFPWDGISRKKANSVKAMIFFLFPKFEAFSKVVKTLIETEKFIW